MLTYEVLTKIKSSGASSISLSLDGAFKETHDAIRGRIGTYDKTIETIRNALRLGLKAQVNTAIMKRNFEELPQILHLIRKLGVRIWELFFLVQVGRGTVVEDLTPEEYESVCNFLYDASHYGVTIRCVEAPFVRRIARQRIEQGDYWDHESYRKLRRCLVESVGNHTSASTLRPSGTLDGDGIIFVAYDGAVYPGGFLPIGIGDVRKDPLVRIYRENDLLRSIRQRRLNGYCGICRFRDLCGGSRARAFSHTGDPLSSDPACILTRRMAS